MRRLSRWPRISPLTMARIISPAAQNKVKTPTSKRAMVNQRPAGDSGLGTSP